LDEAKRWVQSHYVPQLWQVRAAASVHPTAGEDTVADCAQRYAWSLEQVTKNKKGHRIKAVPKQYRSRISVVRRHVVRLFGPMLMAALTSPIIRAELEALEVERTDRFGKRQKRPASQGTRLNVLTALFAIWKHNFPDVPAPFTGLDIRPPASEHDDADERCTLDAQDVERLQHALRADEGKAGLAPDEVTRALIGADHRDRAMMERRNVAAGGFIPNCAHVFSFLVATGVRISEALRVRWNQINFETGFILIQQSKVHTNKRGRPKPTWRIVPLQLSLLPWLEDLRVLSGIANTATSTAFVFRTNARAPMEQPGVDGTVIARAAKTLLYAGIKPARYSTHWGRATHASQGTHAKGIKGEELQHFLGHKAYSGSTDQYVAMLIAMLRPSHRRYIQLPTPAQVRAAGKTFEPRPYDWRAWRTCQSRTNEAKAARRRHREAKVPLGARVLKQADGE
jgi:hypothetical protein